MEKVEIKLRTEDVTKLEDMKGDLAWLDSEIKRAEKVGLDVSDLKKRLIKEGCEEHKIKVHHSGIDLYKFNFSIKKRDKDDVIKVVTVGRLVEKKGISYAVYAIANLILLGKKVTYKIVGDGILRNELEMLITKLGVSEQIQITGWQDHSAVINLLNRSHVLLAPSIVASDGDQEGIPNVLKEAMAMGLPVISTFHGGIPELIKDGVSGFLVPEADIDVLTEKLSYIIDNYDTCSQMGLNGRKYVDKFYNINKLNDRLVTLYQDLITE